MASRPLQGTRGRKLFVTVTALLAMAGVLALGSTSARAQTVKPNHLGELDCNGDSPAQQSVRMNSWCTDIRGFNNEDNANTWDGRFYDNGTYIGHDEPDMTFFSNQAGSGNNVTWTETLGKDPTAAPTGSTPGSDVAHWFELSPAPWFSMMMCDPNSYPQTPCSAENDGNAPRPCTITANPCTNGYPGGGSAFMELQFYPPGFAPFVDADSCDNQHWCSAMTIDSLACTYGFRSCNTHCEEPVNFAYVQRDGIPTGPPSPQESTLSTMTANSETLLMNPGDKIVVHMFDASVPGHPGVKAFKVVIVDLTTGQTGTMQASAANGFMNTSITDCSGTPFNYEPAYNTARYENVTPWGADRTNIGTQYETGHFEPCTSLSNPGSNTVAPGITDTFYSTCAGPYENAAPGGDGGPGDPEVSDAFCYPSGDTHGALNAAPDTITGCLDSFTQNGDLDFDGSPYWTEWPTGVAPTATYPGSFVQSLPASAGHQYARYQVLTDIGLSESTCSGNSIPTGGGTPAGCAVPPPNAPGNFYPYWSRVSTGKACVLEFGNVSSGTGVNTLGGDGQYGKDQAGILGYPLLLSRVHANSSC